MSEVVGTLEATDQFNCGVDSGAIFRTLMPAACAGRMWERDDPPLFFVFFRPDDVCEGLPGRVEEIYRQPADRENQQRIDDFDFPLEEGQTEFLFGARWHTITGTASCPPGIAFRNRCHILPGSKIGFREASLFQPLEKTFSASGIKWPSGLHFRYSWSLPDGHHSSILPTAEDGFRRDPITRVKAESAPAHLLMKVLQQLILIQCWFPLRANHFCLITSASTSMIPGLSQRIRPPQL